MERFLQARGVWLALVLAVSGAFFLSACDEDSPPTKSSCTQLGGACGAGTVCCGGLSCLDGICDARVRCARVGSLCNSQVPCCGGATCRPSSSGTGNGFCEDGSCLRRGAACGSSGACCGGLTCQGGICN